MLLPKARKRALSKHSCIRVQGPPVALHLWQQTSCGFMYSNNGIALHPPAQGPCRTRRVSTAKGVACQAASQKVSRYRGAQQLRLPVSRYMQDFES